MVMMKFALVCLAATAAAIRLHDKRNIAPINTMPVQSDLETHDTTTTTTATTVGHIIHSLVTVTNPPTETSNKLTVIETSSMTVPRPTMGPSTSTTEWPSGSRTSSSADSTRSTVTDSTSRPVSSSVSTASSSSDDSTGSSSLVASTSQTSSTPTSNAAGAAPTANLLAGFGAIAGLVMMAG